MPSPGAGGSLCGWIAGKTGRVAASFRMSAMIRGCGAPESSLEVTGGAQGSASTWADGVARGAAPARSWSVISSGVQRAVGLAFFG